jgi:death on curing protein
VTVVRYLQLDDVLRQVERLGFVLRDAGLLAAALARPQASVFGDDAYPSLWEKAAALCQSLDNNQSLIDGNKRLAWLTTKVFLAINGQRLVATAAAGERFMVDLVAGHVPLESIARWLEEHSQESSAPDLPADQIGS